MIKNLHSLLYLAPIKNMEKSKIVANGMTYGLGEAGYDIRIKQEVRFVESQTAGGRFREVWFGPTQYGGRGKFCLASAIEEFQMPPTLVGIVHDKSSWARQGLSVFNTVIEPGWHGFLTLELVYHGEGDLIIPAGSPIAQVIFHQVQNVANYNGKYQNQENKPTPVIHEQPV
jgi:dCTP deaminase